MSDGSYYLKTGTTEEMFTIPTVIAEIRDAFRQILKISWIELVILTHVSLKGQSFVV